MRIATSQTPWVVAFALMTVGLAYGLAGYPLLEPDEGRNAEVAREMAESNNYLVPRLNALPYVDKPVVFFAATAISMEVFGPGEFAARLVPLLFTAVTLLIVWLFANSLYGKTGAWVATLATGSMPLTLGFARTVIFDSAVTVFATGAIVSLYFAVEEEQKRGQFWSPLGFFCIGLGVLTKGPIALALPLMVIVPYAIWRKRWQRILDPVGWLLLVAIVLPWVAVMTRQVPDFVRYVMVTETVGRLLTDELRRTGPFWYFLPIVFAGSLPWCVVVLSGWKSAQRDSGEPLIRDRRMVFLLLWFLVPLVFFSLSQSKRPQYVVPLMPSVALMVSHLWIAGGKRTRGIRPASIVLMILATIVGLAPWIVGELLDLTPDVAATILPTSVILGGATFGAGAAIWFVPQRLSIITALLCVPAAAIPLSSMGLMNAIGSDRSSREVARAIHSASGPTTEIVTIDSYPLSLPFYLNRTLTLASTDVSELTSNYLIRYADRFRTHLDTPLRPGGWWLDALANCTRPRIFVTSRDNNDVRAILSSRLPLIVSNTRVAAYGPCDAQVLASADRNGHTSTP